MSIIRDLLEYYRLPTVVGSHQDDFEVQNNVLNGYETRYYYDKDLDYTGNPAAGEPYRMVVDMYTTDDIRYRRIFFYYDDDFNVTEISSQYEYGGKQKDDTYTYGPTGEIDSITSTETDVDVTWGDMPPSTGWPKRYSGGSGPWEIISVDTMVETNGRYFVDTLTNFNNTTNTQLIITPPLDPEVNDMFALSDYMGVWGSYSVLVVRNGQKIMGVDDDFIINTNDVTVEFVFTGVEQGWRIVTVSS